MGMSDLQFKAFVRDVIFNFKKVLEENPDNKAAKEMIEHYTKTLED